MFCLEGSAVSGVLTHFFFFFFFNDTATTEIYTLSLHDALPILAYGPRDKRLFSHWSADHGMRSEEHTSELQSRLHLVCRLLLEKKKNTKSSTNNKKKKKKNKYQKRSKIEK